jgi:hypothetical protein
MLLLIPPVLLAAEKSQEHSKNSITWSEKGLMILRGKLIDFRELILDLIKNWSRNHTPTLTKSEMR